MGKALARFKRFMILLQTGWSILGITLVVLLIVEAGLRVTFALRDRLSVPESPDQRILVEGYGGATWPDRALSRDRIARGTLATLCLLPARRHSTARRSPSDPTGYVPPGSLPRQRESGPAQKPVKLLMLGGSSLWGFGARDDQTIPSLAGAQTS